jgi:hypothetical protein
MVFHRPAELGHGQIAIIPLVRHRLLHERDQRYT